MSPYDTNPRQFESGRRGTRAYQPGEVSKSRTVSEGRRLRRLTSKLRRFVGDEEWGCVQLY